MAWVRLPGLSGVLYKRRILKEIDNLIGKVAKLDLKTDYGLRGHFARIKVFINLDIPLVPQILVSVTDDTKVKDANKMDLPVKLKLVESPEPFGPWMLIE
ncbi:hypothetical protein CXB51_027951 [Gossypium anomalum]|uniref:DUF4283 domain-containing protein n=1 Tax=Gossypium anomalum TaxID=47600 RepID=A0A8J6CP73_9ROSI|nr:hypothetical protein CXB51_027951 [Gossypium anomalum]